MALVRPFEAVAAALIAAGPLLSDPAPPARVLEGHGGSVLAVAFSPDGKTLASASRDATIRMWEVRTGKLQRTLTLHTEGVYCVTFSRKGDLLATASGDKTVRLWKSDTGAPIRTLEGHTDIVRWVDFAPDQKT